MHLNLIESGPVSGTGLRQMVTRTGHMHKGIIYEIHKVTPENRKPLRDEAYPFENQFGYDSRWYLHDKVTHDIQDGMEVVLARQPRSLFLPARTVGIVAQELKKVTVDGQRRKLLAVGIRVVTEEYQGYGIGTHLAELSIIRHDPDIVSGQTRVYGIPDIYKASSLIRVTAPLEMQMTEEIQAILKEGLDKTTLEKTDLNTGLYKGFPPSRNREEDSKRFIPKEGNRRGNETYQQMLKMGADPFKGRGIRYIAMVDHDAVLDARQRGVAANSLITYESDAVIAWIPRRVASLFKFRLPPI